MNRSNFVCPSCSLVWNLPATFFGIFWWNSMHRRVLAQRRALLESVLIRPFLYMLIFPFCVWCQDLKWWKHFDTDRRLLDKVKKIKKNCVQVCGEIYYFGRCAYNNNICFNCVQLDFLWITWQSIYAPYGSFLRKQWHGNQCSGRILRLVSEKVFSDVNLLPNVGAFHLSTLTFHLIIKTTKPWYKDDDDSLQIFSPQ